MKTIFKLYSNCIPVTGANRTLICDIGKGQYYIFPNAFMIYFKNGQIDITKLAFQSESENEYFFDFINYLKEANLGFWCSPDIAALFPELSLEWDRPSLITNCIIDTKKEIPYFDELFLNQLNSLFCHYLQIRFFETTSREYLLHILSLINNSHLKSIDLLLMDEQTFDYCSFLSQLSVNNTKIKNVTVHSSFYNKVFQKGDLQTASIYQTKQIINNSTHCGIINSAYFTVNVETFTEANNYNTCLNRKVGIDEYGNIKNCPSMVKTFGNINNQKLFDICTGEEFQKLWHITKDQINICKECEFRFICTDCRAYTDDINDIYSKPLKCGYNPYTNVWEKWSSNPIKVAKMEYYKNLNV